MPALRSLVAKDDFELLTLLPLPTSARIRSIPHYIKFLLFLILSSFYQLLPAHCFILTSSLKMWVIQYSVQIVTPFLFIKNCLLCAFVDVCACHSMCGSQTLTFRSQFSPSNMWGPGTKVRSSYRSAINLLTHWAMPCPQCQPHTSFSLCSIFNVSLKLMLALISLF